ncbi:MAG: hypothetical protein GYB31_20070 [Bacteroidetes bacterium]|nr:hypothetical protein [Bacteroidota bacterium]
MQGVLLIFILHFLIIQSTNASIFQIGSDKPYATPNELYNANVLDHGDTIEIDAALYSGNDALAVWQKDDLLIRGVGGRPHLEADGAYILGKGIWVLAGNNITVENIEFSGATVPDQNGAGIRLDGEGMTVRHCYFHDNENGILTSNPSLGDILIEFSEFANNGFGDGYTHNIYVGHVGRFTFQYNYTHHAQVGHCIKSRARENYILYNRIMDEETGYSSRLIDLPNGGFSVVMGNLMMQGPEAINNNLLGYGLEGLSNAGINELYFINNTCVNKREASCIFVSLAGNTEYSVVANNIFAGTGTLLNGTADEWSHNLESEDISMVGFLDEPHFDYVLTQNSPAVNVGMSLAAVNGFSLTPDKMYLHPTNFEARELIDNQIDAGAYEFGMLSSNIPQVQSDLSIYPNPASEYLILPNDLLGLEFQLISAKGGVLKQGTLQTGYLELQFLPNGVYCLILRKGAVQECFVFMKQ